MARFSFLLSQVQFISHKYTLFVQYLFQKCDPSALAIFRILFGFLMALDVPQERGLEDADIRFGDPNYCFFPLFEWVQPLPVGYVCIIYSIMWTGAIGIMLGCRFRFSCFLYLVPYVYFFLLDKSRWNNHSYLFGLTTMLLSGSDAGQFMSIDSLSNSSKTKSEGVPKWNYFVLKFQIFLLYFFAGVKKLDSDWISGYSMRTLSKHKIFTPFKSVFDEEMINYYMIHIGGLAYDLTVGFMLNIASTKKLAFLASILFHGLNCQLFDIGMFPYVCIASLVIFCEPDEFPCSVVSKSPKAVSVDMENSVRKHNQDPLDNSTENNKTLICEKNSHWKTGLLLFYIFLQLFLPFSHSITKGYNNWTNGLYGYSWDMMVNSWETLHQKVTIVNKVTGEERFLDPDVWVANDRWSSHADQAVQYAHCIARNLARYNITEIAIYLDVWKSLNGRFQQRIYDPRVDILEAPWSPFAPVSWLLPLLREFSDYRKDYFETVSRDVVNWTKSSDVIFVADYPGLALENYMPLELTNVTVTVIDGEIMVEQDGQKNTTLTNWSGKTAHSVSTGTFHKIHITSYPLPSCYMYTYTNATADAEPDDTENIQPDDEDSSQMYQVYNTISDFFLGKYDVFCRSIYLVVNSYLNLLFDVPMVIRKTVS